MGSIVTDDHDDHQKVRALRAAALRLRDTLTEVPDASGSSQRSSIMVLISGSIWLVMGSIAGQGAVLLVNVLVSNHIGVAQFGTFAFLQATTASIAVCSQLGFGVLLARQVAYVRDDKEAIARLFRFGFRVTLAISLVIVVAATLGRDAIADHIFRQPGLADLLPFSFVGLPFLALAYVQQGVLNGQGRFRVQARIALAVALPVILIPTVATYLYGLEGALVGMAAVFFLRFLVNQSVLSTTTTLHDDRPLTSPGPDLRLLWLAALPSTIAGISTAMGIWLGNAVLIRYDATHEQLGLYAAAFTVRTIILFIPNQAMNVLLPTLVRSNVAHGPGFEQRLLWISVLSGALISGIVCTVFAVIARSVMGVFGPPFEAGSTILLVLLAAVWLEVVYVTIYQRLQSSGRFWSMALGVNIPRDVVFLLLAVVLVPQKLGLGLSLAWLGAQIVALILSLLFVARWRNPN